MSGEWYRGCKHPWSVEIPVSHEAPEVDQQVQHRKPRGLAGKLSTASTSTSTGNPSIHCAAAVEQPQTRPYQNLSLLSHHHLNTTTTSLPPPPYRPPTHVKPHLYGASLSTLVLVAVPTPPKNHTDPAFLLLLYSTQLKRLSLTWSVPGSAWKTRGSAEGLGQGDLIQLQIHTFTPSHAR